MRDFSLNNLIISYNSPMIFFLHNENTLFFKMRITIFSSIQEYTLNRKIALYTLYSRRKELLQPSKYEIIMVPSNHSNF